MIERKKERSQVPSATDGSSAFRLPVWEEATSVPPGLTGRLSSAPKRSSWWWKWRSSESAHCRCSTAREPKGAESRARACRRRSQSACTAPALLLPSLMSTESRRLALQFARPRTDSESQTFACSLPLSPSLCTASPSLSPPLLRNTRKYATPKPELYLQPLLYPQQTNYPQNQQSLLKFLDSS